MIEEITTNLRRKEKEIRAQKGPSVMGSVLNAARKKLEEAGRFGTSSVC